jgi:hypothetical protein
VTESLQLLVAVRLKHLDALHRKASYWVRAEGLHSTRRSTRGWRWYADRMHGDGSAVLVMKLPYVPMRPLLPESALLVAPPLPQRARGAGLSYGLPPAHPVDSAPQAGRRP